LEIVQFHSTRGCGTHLVLEMFERVGVPKLVRPVLLLQAILLARRAPDAPCALHKYTGMTSIAAAASLCREIGIPPIDDLASDEAACDAFIHALAAEGFGARSRRVIGHHFYFSHSLPLATPNGESVVWTVADRDATQALLELAAARAGIALRQVALIRNPVDVFLSQAERFAESRQAIEIDPKPIEEYFRHVETMHAAKDVPVVRYEDLCTAGGDRARGLLRRLHFAAEDIGRLDLSVIHPGGVDKWRLYSRASVEPLAARFADIMEPHGYACLREQVVPRTVRHARQIWRRYRSELRVMNAIFTGDFSADAAFSRHRRSALARLWFRLNLNIPSRRRNMVRFYRERKRSQFPARPLAVAIADLVSYGVCRPVQIDGCSDLDRAVALPANPPSNPLTHSTGHRSRAARSPRVVD